MWQVLDCLRQYDKCWIFDCKKRQPKETWDYLWESGRKVRIYTVKDISDIISSYRAMVKSTSDVNILCATPTKLL